jgi:hypothetical protein
MEARMSRRTLTILAIAAIALLVVAIALMAAVMAGAFGPFGHGPFFGMRISPLAWTLMIVAMALGGLGLLALLTLIIALLLRAAGPRE